jgi:hypothetical protein
MILIFKFKEMISNVFMKYSILNGIKEKYILRLVMRGNINLRWIHFNKKLSERFNPTRVCLSVRIPQPVKLQ